MDEKTLFDLQNGPEEIKLRRNLVWDRMEVAERNYSRSIKKEVGELLNWAAEHCFEIGYLPGNIKVVKKAMDYYNHESIGIEVEAEKNSKSWKHLLYFFHKRQMADASEIKGLNLLIQMKDARIKDLQAALKWGFFFLYCLLLAVLGIGWKLLY